MSLDKLKKQMGNGKVFFDNWRENGEKCQGIKTLKWVLSLICFDMKI